MSSPFARQSLLANDLDFSIQLQNATEFARRRKRFFWSVALVISASVFVFASGSLLGGSSLAFYILGLFCLTCWNIYAALAMKCPHCATLPKSYTIDVTSPQSLTAGVNPMVNRCPRCGFYLSKKLLLDDWSDVVKSRRVADC